MKTKALVLALALLLTAYTSAFAQEDEPPRRGPVILTDEQGEYRLGPHLEILEDPSGQLTIQEVTSPEFEGQFTPSQAAAPDFGYTQSAYWVRFDLKNETRGTDEWLLEVGFANMQFVDLYLPEPVGEGFVVKGSGALRPFETRDVAQRLIVFNLPLSPQDEQTIYMRFQSGASMTLGLTLRAPDAFLQHIRNDTLGLGLFYGVLLIMLGYHLFLLYSLREASYVYYVFFLASTILLFVEYDGLGRQYLWPGLFGWTKIRMATFMALFFMSIVKFANAFLELKNKAPRWHRLVTLVLAVWGLLIPLQFFLSYYVIASLYLPWGLVSLVVVWAAALLSWRQGHRRPALLFLSAWIGVIIGVMVLLLALLGTLPRTALTGEAWRVGLVWLVALWSLALAERINLLRVETEEANRELRASEDRLSQVLEAMPVAVVVYGTDRKPRLVNRQAVELLSNPEREMGPDLTLSRSLEQAAKYYSFRVAGSDEVYPLERLPVERALGGEHAAVDDLEIDLVDKRRFLELWASPIFDEWGNVHYAVVAFRDITRRKQAEEDLRKQREHLEELVAGRTAELGEANQLLQGEIAERTRAEEALQQTVTELSVLNRIAHVLTSVSDLPQALDLVSESVTHLFGVSVTFIGQLDAAQTELKVLSRFSHDCAQPELMRLPIEPTEEANLRHELLRGQTQVIQKRVNCPFLGPMGEHMAACDIQTLMLVPLRVREASIGVLGLEMASVERVFTPVEISLAQTIAASLSTALENARLFEGAQAAAAEEERNRMARDLHDSVSQVLFSAGLVAEVLPSIWDSDPEEALESLAELRRLTRGALAEFRTMLLELRPTAVIKTPLGQLMAQLTEAVTSRTQLPFRLHIENVPPLPGEVHTAFYRIAQEALNNVVKHAGASQVTVRLQTTDPVSPQGGGDWKGQVTLSVEDDGQGFTPESRQRERLGMGIMRERAESIGARLSIESQVGQGTQVRLVWG